MQAIRIIVKESNTKINYIDNGSVIFSYDSPIGDEYVRGRKYSKHAGSDWASYVMWCMQSISYIDPVPDKIYLEVENNGIWYSTVLGMQSYAQFYIKNINVGGAPYVIIESNNSTQKDERYKKTISKFKI